MFADIDLRKLAELEAPDRAVLTVYLGSPQSLDDLSTHLGKLRKLLKSEARDDPDIRDERQQFDENVRLVRDYLDDNPLEEGGLCLIACWAADAFYAIPLTAPVDDIVWVDATPYLRPLAELQDEYENSAVVVADNTRARVYLVTSNVATDAEQIKGNIKNHVKKGGWSQQRYERRRDNELLHYARDIVDAIRDLDKHAEFRRIVMVGSKETLRVIDENLPEQYREMTAINVTDLHEDKDELNEDIREAFLDLERQSEEDLWEEIRTAYLQGGRAAVGLADVVQAAGQGRVDTAIIDRNFHPEGRRCRECDSLAVGTPETCPGCGSDSLFEVDVSDELVRLLEVTSAEIEFADPIDTLTEAGGVAARLRY
jgi:peptide chain release factor subunit 1